MGLLKLGSVPLRYTSLAKHLSASYWGVMFQGRFVPNKILMALVAILAGLNIYQFQSDSVSSPVIVNDSQLSCLNGWRPPISTVDIYGPEPFKGMKIAYLDNSKYPKGFEHEFSSCFYDSKIENIHITELNAPLDLLSHSGVKSLYFYKSSVSDMVTIYGIK